MTVLHVRALGPSVGSASLGRLRPVSARARCALVSGLRTPGRTVLCSVQTRPSLSVRTQCASSSIEWSGPPPSNNGGAGGSHGGSGGQGGNGGGSEGDPGKDARKVLVSAIVAAITAWLLSPKPSWAGAKKVAKVEAAAEVAAVETKSFMEKLEDTVECLIFSCRFLVLIAVFGTVGMSGLMFVKGAMTLQKGLNALLAGNSTEVTLRAIGSLDDFLTGCASLVFGMGLYELFISKLDPAESSGKKRGGFSLDHRPNWLHVESLQHLEHNTGAVVIMVLVVNIFENSKKMKPTEPLQLVYMGAATLLSAAAIFIMGIPEREPGAEDDSEEKKEVADEKKSGKWGN